MRKTSSAYGTAYGTTLPVAATGKRPHSMMLHHQASLYSWYWFGGELCLIYSEHDASHRAALCLLRLTITILAWLVFLRRGSPPSTEEPWSSDRVLTMDHPVCMGGGWFQTSSTHRWWRPLCSLGPSKQKNFSSNPSSGLSLEIIPVLSWRSTDNSIHHAWFAHWRATVGPYMNRYVPFQIMSIKINRNKQNTLCFFINKLAEKKLVIMGDCV